MKKIDIQNYISEHLSSYPITIYDSLGKSYIIKSYEQYMEFFNLIYHTYKENIIEFADKGKNFIDYMNSFIDTAHSTLSDTDNISQYIHNNLNTSLHLSSSVNLSCISPNSFSTQLESSKEAFINVYEELGIDKLNSYIELVKTPSRLASYLNDTNNQIVAMKFLLYKTDHHSPKKFKRDLSSKTIYEMSKENISECINSITEKKEDYINYMNNEKKHYQEWFDNTSLQTQKFIDYHDNTLKNLEEMYKQKLKIAEPAKFIKTQANKYMLSFIIWSVFILGLGYGLIRLLALFLSPEIEFNDKIITINILNNEMSVYNSIIVLTMISLAIYLLRIFIKMAISSKHLMEEYKQKYSLTYFYLALVNDDKIQDKNAQNLILASLFNKADTGLIKTDNSQDLELPTLLSLVNRPQ